jgi:hypothetical protein
MIRTSDVYFIRRGFGRLNYLLGKYIYIYLFFIFVFNDLYKYILENVRLTNTFYKKKLQTDVAQHNYVSQNLNFSHI